MSKVTVSPVPHQEVDTVFRFIMDDLTAVYKKTNLGLICKPTDLLKHLRERTMQLWIGWVPTREIVGFAITRVDEYPEGKACTVVSTGASLQFDSDWPEYIKVIEAWAREVEGCRLMFVNGRLGWKKVLKPSGYELDSITLIKVLDDEDHDSTSPPVEQVH